MNMLVWFSRGERNKKHRQAYWLHTDTLCDCTVCLVTSHCIKCSLFHRISLFACNVLCVCVCGLLENRHIEAKSMLASWLLVWRELIVSLCSLVRHHHCSLSSSFCLPLLPHCSSTRFLSPSVSVLQIISSFLYITLLFIPPLYTFNIHTLLKLPPSPFSSFKPPLLFFLNNNKNVTKTHTPIPG